MGMEAEVACLEGGRLARRLADRGVPRVDGFHFKTGPPIWNLWSDVRLLRRLIAERGYDIVHPHLTHSHWIAALALGARGGGPLGARRPALVRGYHRDDPPARGALHRWLHDRATDAHVAVSREGRGGLIEHAGLSPDRVFVACGAVDLKRFNPDLDPSRNRREWSIDLDAPVVGIIARMRPGRGHRELIETVEAVVRRVPKAVFLISGQGELSSSIDALLRSHPRAAHLRSIGYRPNDLPETYAAMDVSVLLTPGTDGSCRAMLEAMACARPVIGVRRGAMADAIEPGKTGWLIERENPVAGLTEALIDALSDRARLAEMGRAARRRVEADFTFEKRAAATQAAYDFARESVR